MKRNLFLGILLLLASCANIKPEIKAQFEGQRLLRKMKTTSEVSSYSRSSFFLFGGSTSSSSSSANLKVWFCWQMNNGDFLSSSVSLDKVRISINEKADTPKVEFIFEQSRLYDFNEEINSSYADIQYFLDRHLAYLRVIVKESDWQPDITLPFNKEKVSEVGQKAKTSEL